jgi:hypothetical protein
MRSRSAHILILLLLLVSSAASANPVRFLGSHPIPAQAGGGYCHVEVAHLHPYRPKPEFLFQEVDGQYIFTADPSPFGYDGERHVFYGHHPIFTDDGAIVYCFLDGAHYHPFAPPNAPGFVLKDGVAFYVGLYSPYFFQLKSKVWQSVNAYYRPHDQLRPTVDVSPPSEWRGGDLRLPREKAVSSSAPQNEHKTLVRFNRDTSTH